MHDLAMEMMFDEISVCFDNCRINVLSVVSKLVEQWNTWIASDLLGLLFKHTNSNNSLSSFVKKTEWSSSFYFCSKSM